MSACSSFDYLSILQLLPHARSTSKVKIDSYNNFIRSGLHNIFSNIFPHLTWGNNRWHVIEFLNLSVHKPIHTEIDGTVRYITPQECKLRGLTYECAIFLHLQVSIYETEVKVEATAQGLEKLREIGKLFHCRHEYVKPHSIPCMVGSIMDNQADPATFQQSKMHCKYDEGGYFIINGTEYNMSYGERLRYNIPIFSKPMQSTYPYEVELRAEHEGKFRASSTVAGRLAITPRSKKMEAKLQFNPSPKTKRANRMDTLQIVLLCQALGVGSKSRILKLWRFAAGKGKTSLHEEVILNSLDLAEELDQTKAIEKMGNLLSNGKAQRALEKGQRYLKRELFPNIGVQEDSYFRKAFWLCSILCQLCERAFLDQQQEEEDPHQEISPSLWSNRDDLTNKAWNLIGSLIGNLQRQILVIANRNLSLQIRPPLRSEKANRKPPDLAEAYKKTKIDPGFRDRFSSGIWHARKSHTNKHTGQTQTIQSANSNDRLEQNMRTLAHVSNESRQSLPRLIYSHWGVVDTAATPDGVNCGVVKTRTPVERSTLGTKSFPIFYLLLEFGVIQMENVLAMLLNNEFQVNIEQRNFQNLQEQYGLISEFKEKQKQFDLLVRIPNEDELNKQGIAIVLNGNPFGYYIGDCNDIINFIVACRRRRVISDETSWSLQRLHPKFFNSAQRSLRDPTLVSAVNLFTDEGRIMRPVLVAENLHKLHALKGHRFTWSQLEELNIVEHIDKVEELFCNIPLYPDQITKEDHYCEIHPASTLGLTASLVALANRTYGTRLTHVCMMSRSALAPHSQDVEQRMDTSANLSFHPERPLHNSIWFDVLRSLTLPTSINCSILFHCYKNLGQEDPLVGNRCARQRGWFCGKELRTNITKQKKAPIKILAEYQPFFDYHEKNFTIKGSIDKSTSSHLGEEIGLFSADSSQGRKRAIYSNLDADGIIKPGSRIYANTIYAQKFQKLPPKMQYEYEKIEPNGLSKTTLIDKRDVSARVKPTDRGIAHTVILTHDREGYISVKAKTENAVTGQDGDKFSSKHGQKGTAQFVPSYDLPQTNDEWALRPLFIVDSVCSEARMTKGQDASALLNEIMIRLGDYQDATTWNETQMKCIKEMIDNKTTREDFDFLETLGDILHNLGFTRDCTRSFIDGRTGKRIPNTMFFATHAMYQLKHRGEKKLRARGTGHKDPITHLPVSKKAKNGGLKLGEQERATLTSNGAAEIVKERLFVSADGTFAYICRFCHTIGFSPHTEVKRTVCWRCSMFNSGDVNEIPHVAKLMEGYLRSMCIATKFYCKRVDKTRLVDAFKHKYGDKQMS